MVDKTKKKFDIIVADVFKPEYTKDINPKYLDFDNQFDKFFNRLSCFSGLKKGLDFGCANCFSLIIGKLIGLNVTGIDIVESPYKNIQNILIKKGYKIYRFDTLDYKKWLFLKDNSFDFVIAMSSLYHGFSIDNWQGEDLINNKRKAIVDQLVRVLKNNGIFFVSPDIVKKQINEYNDIMIKKGIKLI